MSKGDPVEFAKGQKDAREGVPHEAGKSSDYDKGYSFEYEMEAILSAQSRNRGVE